MDIVNVLLRWLVYAVCLLLVAKILPRVQVRSFGSALLAAAVIGLLNALLLPILGVLTLPCIFVTLGLFMFVLNGFLFWLAGKLLDGFEVEGALGAIVGSLLYTILSHVAIGVLNLG